MENTKILKSKLIQLEEEVNSNPIYNIKFHQQKVTKEKMSFSGADGRIWIQPFHSGYDICLSGKSIEKQMYEFMCNLCGKNHNGYKQTKPEPHSPFWRVVDFKLVKKAVYHYANYMTEPETKGEVGGKKNPNVDAITSSPNDEIKSLTAYDIFEKCIIRAENLISVHSSTEKIKEISEEHYCDCFRAAIVLSISALDAFIRKIVITEIRRLLSDDTKEINKELSEYIKNLLNQDKLLEAARKYNLLEKVEAAVKDDFSTKSFQGEWKINSYLNMVGYKDIFSAVSIKNDVNEKNLIKNLTLFTNRRHVIAHSGDYDLNQTPHKEHDINKTYADKCIKIVRLFATTIHEIMEEK